MKKYLLTKLKQISPALIYSVVYLIVFYLLENWDRSYYIVTDSILDQYIPFWPAFVIPYVLWFLYIFGGFVFLLFVEAEGLPRAYYNLFVGMSICLLIYALLPSAQNLRVGINMDKFFQNIVGVLYTADTDTNVCPSIHAYNSLMMMVCLHKTEFFKKHKALDIASIVLAISICASTVLIKQHAIIDVICAVVLFVVVYYIGKIGGIN